MSESRWPAVVAALGIFALLMAINITAIVVYGRSGVDDAMKLVGIYAGLLGIVTGAIASYFFTRTTTQVAQQAANQATATARDAQQKESDALAARNKAAERANLYSAA